VSPGTEGSGRERIDISPTSVTFRNASLSFSIQWAYGVKFYQVSGPDWLKYERYDILAKTQTASPERELRLMMRGLLADRFKLVLHNEQQLRPVYDLMPRKGKPKLQPASANEPNAFLVTDGSFVFRGTTMPQLAERLSDFATVDRPVVDKTGLPGTFNFKLDSAARAIRGGEGPSIFTAITEIGLELRPAREPVEIVVIDGCEKKPSAN
jgi:uncharacterized protein (TIGR03435 family)